MKRNPMNTGRAMSLPGGAAFGASSALLWTIIGSGILGWMISTEMVVEDSIGYGSMIILLSASAIGAQLAWRKVRRQRMVTALCSGGIYLLMLLVMTAVFFGGQYKGFGVTVCLVLGGSAASACLGAGKGTGSRRSRHKIRTK